MSAVMTDEIRVAIERNMPAQVSGVLREVLAKGEIDAKALAAATARQFKLEEDLAAARLKMADMDRLLKEHGDLAARSAKVAEGERDLAVRQLKQDLEAEKRVSGGAFELMRLLTRNVEYRQNISESVPMMHPGGNGCQPYTTSGSGSKSTTTEVA